MIRYTSLSSSSVYGNAYLVEGPGRTRVLVDCGTRLRRMQAYLQTIKVDPRTIDALLITHEHADHTYGLHLRRPLALRHEIPVYAHREIWGDNAGGAVGADGEGDDRHPEPWRLRLEGGGIPVHALASGQEITVGSFAIRPFSVPHDARAPLGFVFRADHTSLGIATDLGNVSDEVAANLCGCTHIVLESNHDRDLEIRSGRPWSLIRRVLGDRGHLSNKQAAGSLQQLVTGSTCSVLLTHLSLECNSPRLAHRAAAESLRRAGWAGQLIVAPADRPTGWLGD